MNYQKSRIQGVTLLEVLLVLVIASTILMMILNFVQQRTTEIRRTRTATQLQQILIASSGYFALTNRWPQSIDELYKSGFISQQTITSPWGQSFNLKINSKKDTIYVYTDAIQPVNAQIILGKIPLGFISNGKGISETPPTSGTCSSSLAADCTYIVAMTSLPGKNLNNASDISFVSIYDHEGCVPEPNCPVDSNGNKMKPEIITMPVSVTGRIYLYPQTVTTDITGYTTHAKGPVDISKTLLPSCYPTGNSVECLKGSVPIRSGRFWRVCLSISTTRGLIQTGSVLPSKEIGKILAITRCKPVNEKSGSDFTVWGQ